MKPNALIDLYVPAHVDEPEAIVAAAARAGLDAIVFVADSPDGLPDADTLEALNAADGPRVHCACVVMGAGFRVAILADAETLEDANLDAIEAANDPALIQAAAAELGGVAISICPRQGVEGEVRRQIALQPPHPPIGVVAMVAGGSRLARDLDIEDAALGGRRILAATGPFGEASDIGRHATLIPADPGDLRDIIDKLKRGFGVGIELIPEGAGRHLNRRGAREDDSRGRDDGGRGRGRRGGGGRGRGDGDKKRDDGGKKRDDGDKKRDDGDKKRDDGGKGDGDKKRRRRRGGRKKKSEGGSES